MSERGVYIIRIYRRDSVRTAGIVESVESGERIPFQTPQQIWDALQRLPSPRTRRQLNQSDEEEQK
jgi:hypothetical protein